MVEEDFQQSKGQVGLDQSQVRRYRSWLRHTILAIAAHAIHAVTAARQREHHPAPVLPAHGEGTPPEDCGMTALTVPETHRLFVLHDETHDLSPLAPRRRTAHGVPRTRVHPGAAATKPEPAGSTAEHASNASTGDHKMSQHHGIQSYISKCGCPTRTRF